MMLQTSWVHMGEVWSGEGVFGPRTSHAPTKLRTRLPSHQPTCYPSPVSWLQFQAMFDDEEISVRLRRCALHVKFPVVETLSCPSATDTESTQTVPLVPNSCELS
jgi:hypothetical protein